MPRKQPPDAEIIFVLKQYESGDKTTDICRNLGVSQATFYMLKKQYAGLGVQELRNIRSRRRRSVSSRSQPTPGLPRAGFTGKSVWSA